MFNYQSFLLGNVLSEDVDEKVEKKNKNILCPVSFNGHSIVPFILTTRH